MTKIIRLITLNYKIYYERLQFSTCLVQYSTKMKKIQLSE